MMLKLIVFDCDGVLFDSRGANRVYYNDLLAAFNRPPMDESQLQFVHSHNVNDSVAHIFGAHPDVDLEAVHRYRRETDYTPYLSFMNMEPDLKPFLEMVKPRYRLAISTNRTTTMRPLLEAYGLNDYFELVVTAMDVQHPKPAPDALLMILDQFGCSPGETIFIGDSDVDQQHATSAGVDLIAFRNKNLNAAFHVDSFMDVLELEPFRLPPGYSL
jgi:phosphoglycolate phosphatase